MKVIEGQSRTRVDVERTIRKQNSSPGEWGIWLRWGDGEN